MLRLLLLSSVVSGLLFFYRPVKLPEIPSVFPVARMSTDGSQGFYRKSGGPFFNGIVSESNKKKRFVRPDGSAIPLNPDRLYSVPFHGAGFFEYEKIGSFITFHGRDGEILWSKEYSSYPVADYTGRLILLLTGDNNRVDLIDQSGNPAGSLFIAGNFLADYDFASRTGAALLTFAGGTVYILNDAAKIVASHDFAIPDGEIFLKSCAIGPEGRIIAVHYFENGRDHVRALETAADGDGLKALYTIDLPAIYPHLLHMAVTQRGLLVAAPDFTAFYDDSGDLAWSREERGGGVYRPVLADQGYYAFLEGDRIGVTDTYGNRIASFPVSGKGPVRILPGNATGEFVVISSDDVVIFRYQAVAGDS